MTEHQIHFGKKFYLDKDTGYWISTGCPKIRAHAWVWITHHGEPPPNGYHIHHVDGDKSNNKIENLQIMTQSDHSRMHSKEYFSDPENLKNQLIHLDNIRDKTKEWHASPEGIEWHRQHGIKAWAEREPIEITCKVCHKRASTKTYFQEFCSNKCKSAWRRDEGLDDIEATCETCKKRFSKNKYSKQKFCSRMCGKGISMQDYEEVWKLKRAGFNMCEIARKLDINRKTVGKIVRANPRLQ